MKAYAITEANSKPKVVVSDYDFSLKHLIICTIYLENVLCIYGLKT